MARTKSQREDEDALDPVEAADVEHGDDPDAGLLELDPEAALDDDGDDDEELDGEGDEDADETGSDDVPDPLDVDAVESDVDEPVSVIALPDAAFDDDDNDVTAVVVGVEDDDDEIEGIRDGEFVCRRCYMAMRETQLADADRLLCRDCA